MPVLKELPTAKNKTSAWVESRLKQHLNQIEKELNRDDDLAFVDNLLRYSKGFWKGLFTFYDYPFLPRTNNDLELFFRRTKVKHRRITGHRTWNRYIINHGENIVFVENVKNEKEGLQKIQNVPILHTRTKQKSGSDVWANIQNKEDLNKILIHI